MQMDVICEPAPSAADAVRRAWDASRPVLVLDPRAPAAERERLLARLAPDEPVTPDVAAVVVTSGTSGEPRGVELTWDGLMSSAVAVTVALEVGPGDRWLCCLPVHHVAGLAILARSWALGTPVDVLPDFDVDAVARSRATVVSLVSVMARRLIAAGVDLDATFRRVLLGGGPIPADLPGVRGYGLTETWGGVVYDGTPLAGADVRLGDAGEILVHGSMVMKGYRLAPDETDAAFTGTPETGGRWLRTGDAGAFDTDGRLCVIDRLRDLVITGGVNVSPTEVEAVLAAHPGVADVGVGGSPDPEWGERVVAYVVPADPSAPPRLEELRELARDRLSPAKLLREVVLVDAIPRTPGGKPQRRLLRDTPPARH